MRVLTFSCGHTHSTLSGPPRSNASRLRHGLVWGCRPARHQDPAAKADVLFCPHHVRLDGFRINDRELSSSCIWF